MRYYIRQRTDSSIQGPFTEQDLAVAIGTGRFSADDLASSDLGDPLEHLQKRRACDWFPLSEIPEYRRLFPLPEPIAPPSRPITQMTVFWSCLATGICFYAATTSHQRYLWLLVALNLLSSVYLGWRYARQNSVGCDAAS